MFRRKTGSHLILTKPGSIVSLSIPDHRELAPGTLRKLIRLAGLMWTRVEIPGLPAPVARI